ncbi:MAG TPA: sugar transferase [Candidatus Paceibacterota bacterium]
MTGLNRQEAFFLFIGDIAIFLVALYLALFLRYAQVPDLRLFQIHLTAFVPLIILWLLVFFIAGLYERHTMILRSRLPSLVIRAQIVNSVIAVIFFYFTDYIGITPKTTLFIYLVVSSILAIVWRIYGYRIMSKSRKQNALLIGEISELRELQAEVNHNDLYPMRFVSAIDFDDIATIDADKDLIERIYSDNVTIIAVDSYNEKISPLLPKLYNLVFSKIRFINLHKFYEEVFNRVPLSLVRYSWFLENLSRARVVTTFDVVKRVIDIIFSAIGGLISLIFYPFIALAIKLDDGGAIFFKQERVGQNDQSIYIHKFRTMANGQVTKVGKFLRRSRLDELPQFWNVLKGDLSIVGPRPEIPDLVKIYAKNVPYYNVRHLIKPGLFGWAQIYHDNHPHHESDVNETRVKLSYDLYYIKNRSLALDMIIGFKTIKILLSRSGA